MGYFPRCLSIILFFATAATFSLPLAAADLTVPEMELITRAYSDGNSIILDTLGDIDIAVEGGYKLGGALTLGVESSNIGSSSTGLDSSASAAELNSYLENAPYIYLKAAEITVRDAFNRPVDISYYTGEIETFASGDIFPRRFGSQRVASLVRGYYYFHDSVVYDGLYTVNGTGLKVESDFGRPWNLLSLYTYQDNFLGPGSYSSDVRYALDTEYLKLETFAGGSYPYGDYGMYHGGILVGLLASERGEFFAQVGIPRLAPGVDALDIGLFYFLFEPRINFGAGSLIFTFFSNPTYYKEYIEIETGKTGDILTNINLLFGRPEETPFAGGIEGSIVYSDDSDVEGIVSPYMSFITQGAVWNLKFNWVATEYSDITQMFSAFIGVRAEF